MLFLAHVYVDRGSREVPVFTNLVFEIAAVGLLDPLREIAEEYKRGYLRSLEHGDIFDLHVLALVGGRGICGYGFRRGGVLYDIRHGYGLLQGIRRPAGSIDAASDAEEWPACVVGTDRYHLAASELHMEIYDPESDAL